MSVNLDNWARRVIWWGANGDTRAPCVPPRVAGGVEERGEDEGSGGGDLGTGIDARDALGGGHDDRGEGFGRPAGGDSGWGGHWE